MKARINGYDVEMTVEEFKSFATGNRETERPKERVSDEEFDGQVSEFLGHKGNRHYMRWNEQETELLKTLKAQGVSYKKIAKKLGRTKLSVKVKAIELGCNPSVLKPEGVSPKRPYRRWTNEEVERLNMMRDNRLDTEVIARVLNRSEASVKLKLYPIRK